MYKILQLKLCQNTAENENCFFFSSKIKLNPPFNAEKQQVLITFQFFNAGLVIALGQEEAMKYLEGGRDGPVASSSKIFGQILTSMT